jgi:DeoR/GlpR family transcriptional regulator of sugar metabolism
MARTSGNISQVQRLDVIRQQLSSNGEVFIAKLAKHFGVSEMTVRRDIDMLESQGEVIRTHGGAAMAKRLIFEFTFRANQQKNLDAKRAIAAAALKHISDGQVVLLDTGTTTLELARLIAAKRKITVITTSLAIVSELQFVNDIETILLGGFLRKGSPDIHGSLTEQNLAQFKCDIAFVGADAVDSNGTTYTDDLRVLNLDRQMAQCATKVVVLADSSKFGKRGMCRVFIPKEYHVLITDSGLDTRLIKAFGKTGITCEIA